MKTIAIDFDGVIHKYSRGWGDGTIYDEPTEGVEEALKILMEKYAVFIFSTRNMQQIQDWMVKHFYQKLYTKVIDPSLEFWNEQGIIGITDRKLPAIVYIDDRALRFVGNWPDVIEKVKEFDK